MKISEKAGLFRLIYKLVLSALLALSGALLIASCCSVNALGQNPFTYETIAIAFSKVSVVIYVTLAVALLGVAVHFLFPEETSKLKGTIDQYALLKKERARRDLTVDCTVYNDVVRERRLRAVLLCINLVLFAAGALIAFIYVLDHQSYTGDYNSDVINGSLRILFCILPSFIFMVVRMFLAERSAKREIALLRGVTKKTASSPSSSAQGTVLSTKALAVLKSDKFAIGARIGILAVAVILVFAGILNGGMADVVEKAIKICTECIGLG